MVRVSGQGSLQKLSALLAGGRSLAECHSHTLHVGTLVDENLAIDHVVIGVYREPLSYTGEDSAEIFCHGGPSVIRSILSALSQAGFREPRPGEFTLRAYLNGKMDLTQAEAVNEIIRARPGA